MKGKIQTCKRKAFRPILWWLFTICPRATRWARIVPTCFNGSLIKTNVDHLQKNSSFFRKEPVRIDFIGLIAYGNMQTDSKDTWRALSSRQSFERNSGTLQEEAKLDSFTWLRFSGLMAICKVALREYLNTNIEKILKSCVEKDLGMRRIHTSHKPGQS